MKYSSRLYCKFSSWFLWDEFV
uniref:Uncharacterized protein n=1 Tax=Vitis vinifera TaxID=29760 RepID=F6HK88_VITVI